MSILSSPDGRDGAEGDGRFPVVWRLGAGISVGLSDRSCTLDFLRLSSLVSVALCRDPLKALECYLPHDQREEGR